MDTCIWIDYFEDRKDCYQDLGMLAWKLFGVIRASKSIIIVSVFVFRELESFYSLAQIRGLTLPFGDIIEKVYLSDAQLAEANKIVKEINIPRFDVIHAILARDNGAILISRDKHFELLKDIFYVLKPEELLGMFT